MRAQERTTERDRQTADSLKEGIGSKRNNLLELFRRVRRASIEMCNSLEPEEFRIQPMAEVSPPWWNLGHTSWFFARNLLQPYGLDSGADRTLDYLLNSYYVSLGPRLDRNRRGLVTRPTTAEIYRYRDSVDRRVEQLIGSMDGAGLARLEAVLRIGLEHEQQHQELFYTEIKYILAENPPALRRPYIRKATEVASHVPRSPQFLEIRGGLSSFGNVEGGWCWDNELPVHRYYVDDFRLQDQLVTNAEYFEFIADGGYRQPLLWLDNGWRSVSQQGWQAPLYWEKQETDWTIWTLAGVQPLNPPEPVCHVSFYEADAFVRWKSQTYGDFRGATLPTERQWEQAARAMGVDPDRGNFLDRRCLHPLPARGKQGCQMAGDVWEWTSSYYEPYPGYHPFDGALAEYNGKFMDNQRVLRGGSCVTPQGHCRVSYRNFWSGDTRFQFTGFRLALPGS